MKRKQKKLPSLTGIPIPIPQTRRETPVIRVCVTPKERAVILGGAAKCNLSISAYVRTLALGYTPAALNDYREMLTTLSKAIGDQGRLGGLLKMWLTNKEQYSEREVMSVHALIERIEIMQRDFEKIRNGFLNNSGNKI